MLVVPTFRVTGAPEGGAPAEPDDAAPEAAAPRAAAGLDVAGAEAAGETEGDVAAVEEAPDAAELAGAGELTGAAPPPHATRTIARGMTAPESR